MQEHIEAEFANARPIRRTGRGAGTWVILGALLIGGLFVVRQFVGPRTALAGWLSDWDQGISEAEKSGKPMLVLFTADWCAPCKQLKRDVLSKSSVATQLKNDFTLVKVDLTQSNGPGAKAAQTYNVHSIPTMIVFDAKGNQVDRLSGGVPADVLMGWLDRCKAKMGIAPASR